MQKLFFTVCAIGSLLLLIPGLSTADPTAPNEIGLYTTPDGYGATGTYELGFYVTVYLVLTKPTDTVTDTPYETIYSFECRLIFNPTDNNLVLMGETFPPHTIVIADNTHLDEGYLEYGVGFEESWPVTNESVVLIEFSFWRFAPGVIEVTLGPISIPRIAGQMGFSSVWPHYEVMHPISGAHDAPVFIFDGEAVAVQKESFGAVKALYR